MAISLMQQVRTGGRMAQELKSNHKPRNQLSNSWLRANRWAMPFQPFILQQIMQKSTIFSLQQKSTIMTSQQIQGHWIF